MKYRDLIKELIPFADEEVNFTVFACPDPENNIVFDEVRFFHQNDNGDFIIGAKQCYNYETFETIGETKIIKE